MKIFTDNSNKIKKLFTFFSKCFNLLFFSIKCLNQCELKFVNGDVHKNLIVVHIKRTDLYKMGLRQMNRVLSSKDCITKERKAKF